MPIAARPAGLVAAVLFVVSSLLLVPGRAASQESQVALDREGRIDVLDARSASRIGVFVDDYPGFHEARLFELADGSFVLEVTLTREGRLVRQRVPMTAAEVEALRERISAGVLERAPRLALNQEGRYKLLAASTTAGLLFYGWAVPAGLGIENPGMYATTAGASFFLPFALTRRSNVTHGMADLTAFGIGSGILNGFLLDAFLSGEDWFDLGDESDTEERAEAAVRRFLMLGVAGSVGSGIAAYQYASRRNLAQGAANAISTGYWIGLANGAAGMIIVQPTGVRAVSGTALVSGAAGMAGGKVMADRRGWTTGDVRVLGTLQLVGVMSWATMVDLIESDSERAAAALFMANSLGALVLADRLLIGRDFTESQANIIALASFIGGITGSGLAATVGTESLVLPFLGAAAGFGITYRMYAGDVRVGLGARDPRWQNLSFGLSLGDAAHRTAERGVGPGLAPPVVSVRYRF